MKLDQRTIEDLQQALREAADVIEKFEMVTTKSNLPDTFRYSMVDELLGLALVFDENSGYDI